MYESTVYRSRPSPRWSAARPPEVLDIIAEVYSMVVTAGVYKAESIPVAEAAKVIENIQRDVNIALMNELAVIFNKIGISTREVLEAAGTKWNFLKFSPGLVGGHCIGVDPYYLTYKAQAVGHHPEVILSGRRINDNICKHIISSMVKTMLCKGLTVQGTTINILGLTFKENHPHRWTNQWLQVILITRMIGLYEVGLFSYFLAIVAPLVLFSRFSFSDLVPTQRNIVTILRFAPMLLFYFATSSSYILIKFSDAVVHGILPCHRRSVFPHHWHTLQHLRG